MKPLILLFLLIHCGIAAAVTRHALLHKADVRAALGWIAIAWLSAVIGGPLYLAFGINRINRRASRLAVRTETLDVSFGEATPPDARPAIQALARVGQRVTGVPLQSGNAVAIHHGGSKAYPEMLEAIRTARHSIALASYIFRDDRVGRAFIAALAAAHERGVEVRVLIDGVGGGYLRAPAFRALRRAGVPCAKFLHSWAPWRMPLLNLRNHKKLLVIDGAAGFTGGLNIGAENLAPDDPSDRVDDVHLRIEGPAARQLMASFAQDWLFTTGETLEGPAWWPEIGEAGTTPARGIRSGPDGDLFNLEAILGAALTLAERRIRIVTPYFLPDPQLEFAIAQAALRGVELQIVIPARSDHQLMDWAMRAHLRFFRTIRAHVRLGAAPFNHAKLVTVDGAWCLIGSSNWDTRSLRLNFEFDLECYDPVVCARIDALIDTKVAAAEPLQQALETGPFAPLRDAAARLLLPYL
jgi:cardiolipin synthase